MTRLELAECMLDGSLSYRPSEDAFVMAQGYVNLEKLIRAMMPKLPEREQSVLKEFLAVDPAKHSGNF